MTSQQVSSIKGQLSDIYRSANSLNQVKANAFAKESTSSVANKSLVKPDQAKKKLESEQLFSKPLPDVVRYSRGKKSVTGKPRQSLKYEKATLPRR